MVCWIANLTVAKQDARVAIEPEDFGLDREILLAKTKSRRRRVSNCVFGAVKANRSALKKTAKVWVKGLFSRVFDVAKRNRLMSKLRVINKEVRP